jgi:AraC-like DNA-binding protein
MQHIQDALQLGATNITSGSADVPSTPRRIAFSAPANGVGSTAAMQLARWCEEYFEAYGGVEITADWDPPAALSLQYLPLGPVALRAEHAPAINGFHRHHAQVARDGDDHFTLIINRGSMPTERSTRSQSVTLGVRAAILFDRSEESAHFCPGGSDRLVLILPRRQTCAALPNTEDLVGAVIPSANEALRLLAYHADGLLDDYELRDPVVLAQAGQHLLDLTVLAFGTDRDNTEVARCRGLRAARLAAVLRRIRLDYTDPQLSPQRVARRVGISTRYLHGLLHETDASFAERVQELRLAKAFALLSDPRPGARKISDAAYAAGFNDLSYFNRSFRRKYGLTPTAARSGADITLGNAASRQ